MIDAYFNPERLKCIGPFCNDPHRMKPTNYEQKIYYHSFFRKKWRYILVCRIETISSFVSNAWDRFNKADLSRRRMNNFLSQVFTH